MERNKKEKYSHDFESSIVSFWKHNNNFKIVNSNSKEFTILMPPPNVTGNLHLGHAWDSYIQDTLIRWKHLHGFNAIWYPGMDHAGIATQSKVESLIYKEENKTRNDLGRDEFLKRIWSWKDQYSTNIRNQWDKLGLLTNDEKESFTLDQDVNDLVVDTFSNLYNKNLIYQDTRIVNWDVTLKTAISDIEVVYKKAKSNLYHIKYDLVDSKESIVVSTTRPETIFGDSAIFVNPQDERFKHLIGKNVLNPLTNVAIKIYSDDYVDPEFGSGLMKATPSHDFNDYELGKKHNLEFINVINFDGTMNEKALFCNDLTREDCREEVVKFLKLNNKLDSIEIIQNQVSYSDRSDSIIEPLISLQWFLKTSTIAKEIIGFKDNFSIEFIPKRFEKDFWNWMEKMNDWCISRQLWWGHRIPVFYNKKDKKQIIVGTSPKDLENWIQDEDVLDTWFSSALWPMHFANKYHDKKGDQLFQTDYLVTGYDIIFFWISKMILMSHEESKKWPFQKVFVHGLIRDSQGRKMSKSLGNGIDPISIIDKYGSDSLRIFLLANSKAGADLKFNEGKLINSWDILNKIFNLNQYFKSFELNDKQLDNSFDESKMTMFEKWIFSKFLILQKEINENIEKSNFSIVFTKLSEFIYDDFSSIYIESLKHNNNTQSIGFALKVFNLLLVLLHSFIPLLTEKIYQELNPSKDSILQDKSLIDFINYKSLKIDNSFFMLVDLIKASRKIRSEFSLSKKVFLNLYMLEKIELSQNEKDLLLKMENLSIDYLNIKDSNLKFKSAQPFKFNDLFKIIFISFDSKDKTYDSIHLINELKNKITFEFDRSKAIVSNEKFMNNASEEKRNEELEKFNFYEMLIILIESILKES